MASLKVTKFLLYLQECFEKDLDFNKTHFFKLLGFYGHGILYLVFVVGVFLATSVSFLRWQISPET